MLRRWPDDGRILAERGFARFETGDLEGAYRDLTEVAARTDLEPSLYRQANVTLKRLEQLRQKAAEERRASLQREELTKNWDAVIQRQTRLEQAGDLAALEAFYSELIATYPGASYGYIKRAYLRIQLGRPDEAREDFMAALERDVTPQSRMDIQSAVAKIDADRRAVAEWDRIQTTEKELREQEDWDSLAAFYDSLVAQRPDSSFAYAARARLNRELGRIELAREDYENAIRFENEPQARDELRRELREALAGRNAADSNGIARRTGEWEEILKTRDELDEQGDWDRLDALYTNLIEHRPEYESFAVLSRAHLRRRLGRYAEAKRDFERALTLDLLEKDRAEIRDIIAELTDAEQDSLAKRREENRWNEVQRIRKELTDKGEWDQLEAFYAGLIEKDEYPEFAYSSRGYQYFYGKRYAEAKKDFAALLARMDDPKARLPYQEMIAKIDDILQAEQAERRKTEEQTKAWNQVLATQRELTEREDWLGLEEFFAVLIAANRYPEYAHASRGYQYFYGKQYEKARADFQAALEASESSESRAAYQTMLSRIGDALRARREERRREEAAGAAWAQILQKQKELTEAGDWTGLETFYDRLIAEGKYLPFAYSSRGYQHFYGNRLTEARKDFLAAAEASDSEEAGQPYREMLAAVDAEVARQKYWQQVEERAETLRKKEGNYQAVVELYVAEAARKPDDAHPVAMRGYAQYDIGRIREAEADFAAAMAMSPKPDIKGRLEETIKQFADLKAEGKQIGSGMADRVLWRMSQKREAREFQTVLSYFPCLEPFILSEEQQGRRDFFHAEALWGLNRHDEAYPYYFAATKRLDKGWYLSETYGQMAQYNFDRKQPALAEEYLTLGDRKKYGEMMRRQIDVYYDKLEETAPGEDWNRLRTDQNRLMLDYESDLQRIKGYQLFFATRNDRGDYMMQYQNDINYAFGRTKNLRFEAYAALVLPAHNKFSGEWYDSWSNQWFPYTSHQYLKDGKALHLGLRWYPIPSLDHNIGLERVFGVGRQVEDDVRLRLRYWKGIGYKYEPVKKHWFFTTVDSDLMWSFKQSNLSYRHDRTVGYSFKLHDRFVATPIAKALFSFSGRLAEAKDRYGLEAGVGLRFQYLFRGDRYKAPADAVEWSFVYNVGVTKNRPNSVSFSIVHGF